LKQTAWSICGSKCGSETSLVLHPAATILNKLTNF